MSITFIGSGPSTIFSILYLLDNGYKDKLIVIDKGNDPYKRVPSENLYGFFGAGCYSDMKFIFSEQVDAISNKITLQERLKIHNYIKEKIEYYSKGLSINKSIGKNIIEKELDKFDINLNLSESYHLGSINAPELGKRIYEDLIKKGVIFFFNKEITDVDFEQKLIRFENGCFGYDNLQIGLGRTGDVFLKKLIDKYNLKYSKGSVHIGGRFECQMTKVIENIVENIQYDFKFYKQYTDEISLRTFCANSYSAYVAEENDKGYIQYNGHAFGKNTDKENGLCNFAILAEIKNVDVFEFQKKILPLNPYVVKGDKFNFNSSINFPSEKHYILEEYDKYFKDFIRRLDSVMKFDFNWLFFVPEIKRSNGILETDENFVVKNVAFVGDMIATRGICPAAVSGIKSIERFL